MEYQKINTLYKRDENNNIILGDYTIPEFEYLKNNLWECTEKIDGTNIRIEVVFYEEPESGFTPKAKAYFIGRADKTNIPTHLYSKLEQIFGNVDWKQMFPDINEGNVTLFGEGYGTKIQKGGSNYISNDVDFILFDVRIGNWWLNRESLEDIANKLNIKIVPLIGYMTIPEAEEMVKNGFKSRIAENKDFEAEGLVLKTPCGLLLRNGKRIITKIKTKDFRKLMNYGNNKR